MKIKILGCYGSSEAGYNLTSFLINDRILLDAGDGVSTLSFDEQVKIEKIIISHAHLDHICGLPFVALNLHEAKSYPVDIIATEPIIKSIRDHVMNDRIWPDFTHIPSADNPVYRYREISKQVEVDIGGIFITPIQVLHTVPTYGYIIRDENNTVIYTSDTSDACEIFEIANKIENLRAIIVEVTFSTDYQELADDSKHLTPFSLERQLEKLKSDPDIYLYHMKSSQLEKIEDECRRIDRKLTLLTQGETYNFGS